MMTDNAAENVGSYSTRDLAGLAVYSVAVFVLMLLWAQ